MSLEGKVLHSLEELLPTHDYGPGDSVLLTDTSFLMGFSNYRLWAWQVFLEFHHIVESAGKRGRLCAPLLVAEQYKRHYDWRTCDEFGIPLAQEPYERLFGGGVHERLPAPLRMLGTLEEAMATWKGWQQKRAQFAASRGDYLMAEGIAKRRSAGMVDIDIILQAIRIAETGAGVYVASSDFKDVINPLLNRAEEFRHQGLSITVMQPSSVNPDYFGTGELKGTVTGEVLKELQAANASAHSYTLVVFEKVRSGNAEFLAGVGVVQKRHWRPTELPPEFESIPKAYRELVPVLRIESLEGLSQREEKGIAGELAGLVLALNVREVVMVQGDKPYNVLLGFLMGSLNSRLPDSSHPRPSVRLFRADLKFLRGHTTSLYAAANYKPQRR